MSVISVFILDILIVIYSSATSAVAIHYDCDQ